MTYKEIQCAIAALINEKITVGKHGESIANLAVASDVVPSTVHGMLEGRINSMKAICKVLDTLGYEFQITALENSKEPAYFHNGGVRIECYKCRFTDRYTKASIFLKKGWSMVDKYKPLCPCCSEKYQRQRDFQVYFRKMKEYQEISGD